MFRVRRSWNRSWMPSKAKCLMSTKSFPLVDISPLMDKTASQEARQVALKGMRDSCVSVGFFCIPATVLPMDLLPKVYNRADEFNSLPVEIKQKYHVNKVSNARGWTPLYEEPSYEPGVISHLEGFDLAQELPAECSKIDNGLGPNVWPEELPQFQHDVMTLYDATTEVSKVLFEGFAEMLDLPRDTFQKFNTPYAQGYMRILTYPENDFPTDDKNMGIAAHTDFECFTIIHQNNYGLQLKSRATDSWLDTPVSNDRLFIMVGDVLERWTNGLLKATPHRVLNTSAKRQSIVRFNGTEGSAWIEPMPQFVSPTNPAKYPRVTQRQHIENEIQAGVDNLNAVKEGQGMA